MSQKNYTNDWKIWMHRARYRKTVNHWEIYFLSLRGIRCYIAPKITSAKFSHRQRRKMKIYMQIGKRLLMTWKNNFPTTIRAYAAITPTISIHVLCNTYYFDFFLIWLGNEKIRHGPRAVCWLLDNAASAYCIFCKANSATLW